MENILYLDDYINFYNKKIDNIICQKPYKKTLQYGKIIDRKKFIKKFNQIKEEYKLNNSFFNEQITIIINSKYTEEDKILLKEIMEELNYKKINFIKETNLIKINNKTILINYNNDYFYLYYVNQFGNIELKVYENDSINKILITKILKIINKDIIVIMGKKYQELSNLLKKTNYKYYYYEKSNNLFINLLIDKSV